MAEVPSNPVPFEVIEDVDYPPRIGLELTVYPHNDPFTPLDVIPNYRELKCLDELGGPGGGSFLISRHDAKFLETPTLIHARNVYKIRVDGKVVGGFLGRAKNSDYINREERSGETWEVSGEGLRGWFHDAVVEPFGGIRKDSQSSRVFSFASERGHWYVEADWVAPVVIQDHQLDPNEDPFGTAPADWPDAPGAKWVWGVDNDDIDPAPAGMNYFRHEFDIEEVDGAGRFSVFAAAKDQFEVFVDGQNVIQSTEDDGWTRTWRADFSLNPGHHVLAIRVLASGAGKAGLIAALFRAGDASLGTSAELLTVTNTTDWVVNSYPDPAPGWTPGEIMLTLLAEADSRGVRFPGFLTPTFTEDEDSTGLPWPRSLDWAFDIGAEYSDVVAQLEEAVCDVWIDSDNLELHMYVERGVHRDVQSTGTQPVKFEVGRNVVRATEEETSDLKNALLLATEDGWSSVADGTSTSQAEYGRIEGYVSTGASEAVSSDVAQRVFQQKALPKTSSTYDIIDVDDARPFFDFQPGDWALAPSAEDEYELTPRRVMSISVSADRETGWPKYALEFDTISEDSETRFERWLKATGTGTLGGTLSNVSIGGGGGGSTPSTQAVQRGPQGLQGEAGPPGINWQGTWSGVVQYETYDAVAYDNRSWIAVHDSLTVTPGTDSYYWELLADSGGPGPAGPGLSFRGLWSAATTYAPNDLVSWDDKLWVTASTNINEEPGVSSEWLLAGIGSSGRATVTYTTASIAADASEQGSVSLAKGFRLYKIETDEPARVRLYATSAQQAADAGRGAGTDPVGDHGLLFEFITTDSLLSAVLSPLVDGVSMESIPSALIPITVTNLSGSTDTIQVTFTYVETE